MSQKKPQIKIRMFSLGNSVYIYNVLNFQRKMFSLKKENHFNEGSVGFKL